MLINVKTAAEMLGVSHMTVRRLIANGDLAAWRVNGNGPIRIEAKNVEALKVPVHPAGATETQGDV